MSGSWIETSLPPGYLVDDTWESVYAIEVTCLGWSAWTETVPEAHRRAWRHWAHTVIKQYVLTWSDLESRRSLYGEWNHSYTRLISITFIKNEQYAYFEVNNGKGMEVTFEDFDEAMATFAFFVLTGTTK
jgi:hypothetical protein